jgi:hypothetical protein
MTPDHELALLRDALRDPLHEPPPDLLAQLLRQVPPPLTPRERREQWAWALAPLAGGAVLACWALGTVPLALPDLRWLPPLLLAAALHAVLPRLLTKD